MKYPYELEIIFHTCMNLNPDTQDYKSKDLPDWQRVHYQSFAVLKINNIKNQKNACNNITKIPSSQSKGNILLSFQVHI